MFYFKFNVITITLKYLTLNENGYYLVVMYSKSIRSQKLLKVFKTSGYHTNSCYVQSIFATAKSASLSRINRIYPGNIRIGTQNK